MLTEAEEAEWASASLGPSWAVPSWASLGPPWSLQGQALMGPLDWALMGAPGPKLIYQTK